jgi:hypothetical protein
MDDPLKAYVESDQRLESLQWNDSRQVEAPLTEEERRADARVAWFQLWLVLIFIVAPLLGGPGIFAWQILHFLQAGTWEPVSVVDVLRSATSWDWTYSPKDWIGVWRILDALPASFSGGALGFVDIWIGISLFASTEKARAAR